MNNEYNLSILEALFNDYLFTEKISRVSIKNYRSDIKHFLNWFYIYMKAHLLYSEGQEIGVSYIELFISQSSSKLIEDYKKYLLDSQIPVKTINRRLSAIRKFYLFCVKRGYFNANHAESITNVVPVRNTVTVTIETQIKDPLEEFKSSLSDNLSQEKQAQIINDMKEFMELWS